MSARVHLWLGEWIDDAELERRLPLLGALAAEALPEPPPLEALLDAAEAVGAELRDPRSALCGTLSACLAEKGLPADDVARTISECSEFLARRHLETKLRRELGGIDPFDPVRPAMGEAAYEAWAPLGLLVHVAPTNAAAVGALSVVEGLLAGNFNALKTGGSDSLFAQHLLEALGRADASGRVARRIVAARVPSRRKDWLKRLFAEADGVAVWGGEDAISGVRALSPSGARLIEWGPKISIAYVARSHAEDAASARNIARGVCEMEQQACASPQCVYLETSDKGELEAFAEGLARELESLSPGIPRVEPETAEAAEITMVRELTRAEEALGLTRVLEPASREWRVLVDHRPALRASPLYRTVWVKPLPRERIVGVLRPMRGYLQTVGLACGPRDLEELSRLFFAAGALRVTSAGGMLGSYAGEPHDGVYALPRYARRVSVQAGVPGIARLSALRPPAAPEPSGPRAKIMSKEDFQKMEVDPAHSHLFFRSGGSSGEPKLSVFSYADYHLQMHAAAEGLLAAGLDPARDRCMNLFFGGGLYGGFVSFFTILEAMEAVQFPMAAHMDFGFVADTIVRNKVNVLLGMPSYLGQLFEHSADNLRAYGGIEKVYFGGEHFGEARRERLRSEFGVRIIRSASYGSVDAGPLGYQCVACEGSVHHLHQRLQSLEILDLHADRPADPGVPGRLVFTSRARRGQRIERYDIGDLGRWVEGECACGGTSPRFELMGRHGDVFRAGGTFLNARRVAGILEEHLRYAGETQLVIRQPRGATGDALIVRVQQGLLGAGAAEARRVLLEEYPDLREAVEDEGLLTVEIEPAAPEAFARTSGSGKLRAIVDER